MLDEDQLGSEAAPEAIIASVAVSNGRVFLVTDANLYCIGKKSASTPLERTKPAHEHGSPTTSATHVQVVPAELTLKPGDRASFRVRLFDARGNFVREEKSAEWSLDKLKGTVANGQYASASDAVVQTGEVRATVGGLAGAARVRVIPPLPINENFDAMEPNTFPQHWTNAGLKYIVREVEGNKVLVKTTEGSSLLSRARAYFGPVGWSDYTTEVDVRATERRRLVGDAGVIAQRYALVLFGNAQKLEISSWQPETARVASVPFAWKPDIWYRMKLRVENLPGGKVRARGKAWPASEPEPAAWTVERVDPIGNRQGSPGIFGGALAEIYFDNLKVTPNK